MAYKQSPFNFYEGDPKKKESRKAKRAERKEGKEHNKHARQTEGSLVRQSLRRQFGSNKPK